MSTKHSSLNLALSLLTPAFFGLVSFVVWSLDDLRPINMGLVLLFVTVILLRVIARRYFVRELSEPTDFLFALVSGGILLAFLWRAHSDGILAFAFLFVLLGVVTEIFAQLLYASEKSRRNAMLYQEKRIIDFGLRFDHPSEKVPDRRDEFVKDGSWSAFSLEDDR